MKVFFFILVCVSVIRCSVVHKESTSMSSSENSHHNSLLALESKLIKENLTLDTLIAKQLYKNSITFLRSYPKSIHNENVMVLAAKCTDGLNLNKENIDLIDQLIEKFPQSENAPNYLYNKGKIYEEKLHNIPKAKIVYKELIEKYPNSEIGKSLVTYLVFLDKSEEEQLEYLNPK